MEIKAIFVRLDTADVKARKIRQTRNQTSRTTGFLVKSQVSLSELGQKNVLKKDSFKTCRKRQLKRGFWKTGKSQGIRS